jgi:hypothetical protein
MIWINDNRMVPSPVNMTGDPKFPNLVPLFFAASFYWHGDGHCPGERQLLFCWRDVDVFLQGIRLLGPIVDSKLMNSWFCWVVGVRKIPSISHQTEIINFLECRFFFGVGFGASPGLHHCLFRITLSSDIHFSSHVTKRFKKGPSLRKRKNFPFNPIVISSWKSH